MQVLNVLHAARWK